MGVRFYISTTITVVQLEFWNSKKKFVKMFVKVLIFLALAIGSEAINRANKFIQLSHAVSKATYLPISGSKYLQNGKITENPSSTKFGARCPYGYPEMDGAICYQPCQKRSGWARVNGIGPVCWGCPSSHPSEEVCGQMIHLFVGNMKGKEA